VSRHKYEGNWAMTWSLLRGQTVTTCAGRVLGKLDFQQAHPQVTSGLLDAD